MSLKTKTKTKAKQNNQPGSVAGGGQVWPKTPNETERKQSTMAKRRVSAKNLPVTCAARSTSTVGRL